MRDVDWRAAEPGRQPSSTPAFSPSPQPDGVASVGIRRGPGYARFDFTLAKDFRPDDRPRFQFRTGSFNAFNRVNLAVPNVQRESTDFGRTLKSGNARIVQRALKFYF